MIRATMAGLVILLAAALAVTSNTEALATCQQTHSSSVCAATLK